MCFAVTGERRQLAPVLESSCVTSVCLDMEAYDRSTIMEELKEDANAVMQRIKRFIWRCRVSSVPERQNGCGRYFRI